MAATSDTTALEASIRSVIDLRKHASHIRHTWIAVEHVSPRHSESQKDATLGRTSYTENPRENIRTIK